MPADKFGGSTPRNSYGLGTYAMVQSGSDAYLQVTREDKVTLSWVPTFNYTAIKFASGVLQSNPQQVTISNS